MASTNAGNDGWETVADESPTMMVFDTIGDQFIGTYGGIETVTPEDESKESFDRALFRTEDGPFATNLGYGLKRALGKVNVGDTVRITYVKDIDTGQPSPMKDYRVDVKRG